MKRKEKEKLINIFVIIKWLCYLFIVACVSDTKPHCGCYIYCFELDVKCLVSTINVCITFHCLFFFILTDLN